MTAGQRMGLCMALLLGGLALAQPEAREAAEEEAPQRYYVQLGGGVEGYTGRLAPTVDPGPSYGARVGVKPLPALGLEAAFSGGLASLDVAGDGGDTSVGLPPARAVRNGLQLAAVVGLTTTRLQPYVVGGVGLERYNIQGPEAGAFQDDTSGYVPAGGGVRLALTPRVSADLRATYNFLLGSDFAPLPTKSASDGRYSALLSVGASY